ncbi:MAG: DUF2974 domain-containing protein [Ruminiclostridium sp.]|nr:DUF2974 domain-containing protein [Ruminiclostridium sp.]MBQ9933991.1 DUF2974 domain-containing protein [Ruminiclostridium sp.]
MSYKNCLDYLNTYGRLPLSLVPFNEIDSLILSMCVYGDFDGILPGMDSEETLPLHQGIQRLTQKEDWAATGPVMAARIPELLLKAARAPRYGRVRLGCYVSILDEARDCQFAALTYLLPDGTNYLAFRGTDDTLVGWKESFSMAYHFPVRGQELAAEYIIQVAGKLPGKLRLGGHSKGGNLAVWAAIQAPPLVRARIHLVDSFDGPGFARDLTSSKAYRNQLHKIDVYVPQSSIVGTLLHPTGQFLVIHSHGSGIQGQHDPFTWEVRGTAFRYRAHRSVLGRKSAATLHRWLESLAPWELEAFVELIFYLLSANDAHTLTDIAEHVPENAKAIAHAYRNLDKPTRRLIRSCLGRLMVSLGPGKEHDV